MKRVVLIITVVLFIFLLAIFPLLSRGTQRCLLRKNLDQVEMVRVINYGLDRPLDGSISFILTPGKDKDLISKVYNIIVSTKLLIYMNPNCEESQESDPLFGLIFTYKNGESDAIESTETGKFIFRRLSWNGWIGGPCEDLIILVKELQREADNRHVSDFDILQVKE